MSVIVDRETLALDLRTYGEDKLAERIRSLDDDTLGRIQERADHYLYNGEHMLIARAVSLAAVEVLEEAPRELRWKRRKLKGIWPGQPTQRANVVTPVNRRQVERAINAALTEAGYTKAAGEAHIFLKSLTEDVKGWVSYLAQRAKTGEIEVTPTVGIRHERLHELIDRLEPARQPYAQPTATIILGYLMPQNSAAVVWRFDAETPTSEQAENLAEHVQRYGEPWMRERVSQEAIIEVVRADQRGSMPVHPGRLPAALLLAGRREDAREALDAELKKAEGRSDAAAENFRRFADRFRAEVLPVHHDCD